LRTSTVKCPCCGFSIFLKPYQSRKDMNGNRVAIDICLCCTSLVNRSTLELALADEGAALREQELGSKNFYEIDKAKSLMAHEVDALELTLKFMFSNAHAPIPRNVAIDLGAGLGYLAAAACRHFDSVWALEINRWTLDQMIPYIGDSRLSVGSSLDDVPGKASAVFMWHTIEHLPAAWEVGLKIADKLEDGGVFFWQVPMYRDTHVCSTHFTFFNVPRVNQDASSASIWMRRIVGAGGGRA
jgi:hypothetical protein